MALAAVSLDDKYTLERGRIYLNGTQALVRLPMIQRQRDMAAGLNTAGFISGYRGSPLGALDQQLAQARRFIEKNSIHFQPGLNEDLAATSIWGSQQVGLFPGARHDGVFAMWYGKGPGVDRSGDVFKHANAAGTARHGGVLALAGDDHACKSSTFPHQSEQALIASMMPVLNPASVAEFIELGLFGFALSRYSGLWVGFKTLADTVDSSTSIEIDPFGLVFEEPDDFQMPPGGTSIRWPDPFLEQEKRLVEVKLPAALAFARANSINFTAFRAEAPRLGIVAVGKSYTEVGQALDDLGLRDRTEEFGLSLYKVGMSWPLEPEGIRAFAAGHEEIMVVEEKRSLVEAQLKEALYHLPADRRPRVTGKTDEAGAPLLPETYELNQTLISRAIIARLGKGADQGLRERLNVIEGQYARKDSKAEVARTPFFCSGCPHNTSTNVPEGSRAMAGIGCHFMAGWMDRRTDTFTQMGGEGTPWIGQAPFTETRHIFANLGDGTYNHSGILAIRAAVAAGVNITYKVLFNDAVAMTGGQAHEGSLTVPQIVRQLAAEGVRSIVVMTEDPDRYNGVSLAGYSRIEHRDELDKVQRDLREEKGVTALVYDQTCAAEKRRRRKRGLMEDPAKRVMINELVCEGCGDCSVKSNCVSVVPVETEYGRKRQIDQSTCNKDFSCVKGFCPSFVTVEGGGLRKPATAARPAGGRPYPVIDTPEPSQPSLETPYSILVTGVGGTGVVTIGALLGMAAHMEGKGVSVLDQAGLAQKGGPVTSHLRFGATPAKVQAARIPAAGADLILGCDLLVAADGEALSRANPGVTKAVINTHQTITGDFTRNPDLKIPAERMVESIRKICAEGGVTALDATGIATALMGNSIATNLFMLGVAYQRGTIPISAEAILKAIELNGVSVKMNQEAFAWGRRAAVDAEAVSAIAKPPVEAAAPADQGHRTLSEDLDTMIERRVAELTAYQDEAYASRYRALVDVARIAEARVMPGKTDLSEAVARYAYKVMAIKDEYEVARLYTDGRFLEQLNQTFDGDFKLTFHLAPPLIAPKDEETGHLKKVTFGPWMLKAFGLLARFRKLRGTAFDVFGRTEERRMERGIREDYFQTVEDICRRMTPETYEIGVDLARIPEHIRGYGHVKERHVKDAKAREAELLAAFNSPHPQKTAAE